MRQPSRPSRHCSTSPRLRHSQNSLRSRKAVQASSSSSTLPLDAHAYALTTHRALVRLSLAMSIVDCRILHRRTSLDEDTGPWASLRIGRSVLAAVPWTGVPALHMALRDSGFRVSAGTVWPWGLRGSRSTCPPMTGMNQSLGRWQTQG